VAPKYRKLRTGQRKKGNASLEALRKRYASFQESSEAFYRELDGVNWNEVTAPADRVTFVSNPISRVNQEPICLQVLLELSENAGERIYLQSPYTIPSRRMRNLYRNYDIDASTVTLLTNSEVSSPNLLGISAYMRHRPKILEGNVNIYEFNGMGSIHAKSAIFDDSTSVVGTFNIDPRSSYLNTESMVVIESKPFTSLLEERIHQDFEQSILLTSPGDTSVKKIVIRIFSFIMPLFEHLL